MPFGDGTGPFGEGPLTGRRGGGRGRGRGLGRGMGRGFGRGLGRGRFGGVAAGVFPKGPVSEVNSANPNLTSEQEEIAREIYELLPKINCGACGYPTCMDCARAVARGDAPYNACRVLRPDKHEEIKKIIERR